MTSSLLSTTSSMTKTDRPEKFSLTVSTYSLQLENDNVKNIELIASLPPNQSVLQAQSQGTYTLNTTHALPCLPLLPTHLLIRISHVALSPCNWKMIDFSTAVGSIGGNDFSGTVIAIGSEVSRRKVGDKVFGFLYGFDPHVGKGEWAGAFAEYAAVEEGFVMQVPSSVGVGMAEAACLGGGVLTAGMALFQSLGLEVPDAETKASLIGGGGDDRKKEYILIYGGSTASGTMAIQLATLAGYIPITTCSPANFALVTSFGAHKAFDYHSMSCGVAIRAFTKGRLRLVLDCISNSSSLKICYTALGSRGGKYTALEPPPERLTASRRDLQTNWVMVLTIYGKAIESHGTYGREARPEDAEWARDWFAKAERLAEEGKIRPHPGRAMPGGWSEVLCGIEQLRKGLVRGEKLVYKIEKKF